MDRRHTQFFVVLLTVSAISLSLAAPAPGQTGPDLLLKQFRAEDQFELTSDWFIGLTTETDNRDVEGDSFDLRADIFRLDSRIRLTPGLSEEGIARAQPRAGLSVSAAQFDTFDPAIPTRMLDTSIAVGMGVLAYSGWLGGVTIGAGVANSNNEDDGNGLYLEANFAIGKTFANDDSFGIVINYDGNRTLLPDWPLPGAQYLRKVGDQLTLTLGFPFSGVVWEPNDTFSLRVNYVIPDSFNARADYKVLGDLALFGSLNSSTLATHWDELEDGDDRVFFERSQIELGISYDADPDKVKFIISVGYAFEQEFSSGFDTRDLDTLAEVDDGLYLRTGFELRL